MFAKPHQQTVLWLIVSAALLATLIPGGPIEHRDFSHIHAGILGVFNVFLTVLDLGSIVLAYFAFKRHNWAIHGAFISAIAYFAVYAVDLAQVFPQSPTPMSSALALIEVLGMTTAVPLMFAARRATGVSIAHVASAGSRRVRLVTIVSLVVVGVAIVWFATDSAMHSAAVSLATQRSN